MLVRQLVDGAPRRHSRDVHHHIHRRVVGVDVGGELVDRVVVGDVESAVHGHHPAQRAGIGDGLLQALGVAVGQEQSAPSAASFSAVARPMPLAAPVEKTTLSGEAAPGQPCR